MRWEFNGEKRMNETDASRTWYVRVWVQYPQQCRAHVFILILQLAPGKDVVMA